MTFGTLANVSFQPNRILAVHVQSEQNLLPVNLQMNR